MSDKRIEVNGILFTEPPYLYYCTTSNELHCGCGYGNMSFSSSDCGFYCEEDGIPFCKKIENFEVK